MTDQNPFDCDFCGEEFTDGDEVTEIRPGDVSVEGKVYTQQMQAGLKVHTCPCLARWASAYSRHSPFVNGDR